MGKKDRSDWLNAAPQGTRPCAACKGGGRNDAGDDACPACRGFGY